MSNVIYKSGSPLFRFAASILDGFILITLSLPILLMFGRSEMAMLLSFCLTILYHAYTHASQAQATPGEQILKLYVIRNNGARLTFRQSLERALAYFMPFLPQYASIPDDAVASLISFLVFCWFAPILLTRNATGLHDLLCNTRVVSSRIA